MRPRCLLLLAALLPAACNVPAERLNATQYRQGTLESRYPLEFLPGQAEPVGEVADALAELRPQLRRDMSLTLEARAPLAQARAAAVGEALGQPVAVDTVRTDGLGRNEATLVVGRPGIVADACAQPPGLVGRNLWTFDDYSRQGLLPPGCATALMLQRQAADPRDMLRGRALAPGAASPMAQAADNYLRRNDVRRARDVPPGRGVATTEEPGTNRGAADTSDPGGTTASSGSAGPGPVTPAPASPGQAAPPALR